MTSIQMRSFKTVLLSAAFASIPLFSGSLLVSSPAYGEAVKPVQEEMESQAEAPNELLVWLQQMDETASQKRLKAFMRNFDTDFTHKDGLSKRQLKQAVKSFWKQFDQVSYQTTIDSWTQVSPGVYTTVTSTMIEGRQEKNISPQILESKIRSEQRIENGKIISQEILEEKTQITSGEKPPTVRVNLPQTVQVGEDYFFDVIVDEPLGDRILLGAAIEESVNATTLLNSSNFDIQPLSTGGLFKIGQAPDTATDQWISALLIQDGGMYLMSQRISVVDSVSTAFK